MKISELIAKLAAAQQEYGDVRVTIRSFEDQRTDVDGSPYAYCEFVPAQDGYTDKVILNGHVNARLDQVA